MLVLVGSSMHRFFVMVLTFVGPSAMVASVTELDVPSMTPRKSRALAPALDYWGQPRKTTADIGAVEAP